MPVDRSPLQHGGERGLVARPEGPPTGERGGIIPRDGPRSHGHLQPAALLQAAVGHDGHYRGCLLLESDIYDLVTFVSVSFTLSKAGELLRRPGSHGVGWGWFLVVLLVLMWGLGSSSRVVAQEQPVFGDVTEGAFYEEGVASLAGEGVFDGTECEEGMFCPQRPLLRWEMAVWVVRVVDGGDPAAIGESRFGDVETGVWFAPFVERMFLLEVTRGCGDDRFCPHDVVTRGQMAAFLTRAFGLPGGPDPGFVDVPAGAPFFDEVAALAASGITKGCGDGGFCPDRVTSRGEMATFLYRGMTASDEGDGSEGAGGVGGFGDVVAGGAHSGDIATLGGLGVLEGTGCAGGFVLWF